MFQVFGWFRVMTVCWKIRVTGKEPVGSRSSAATRHGTALNCSAALPIERYNTRQKPLVDDIKQKNPRENWLDRRRDELAWRGVAWRGVAWRGACYSVERFDEMGESAACHSNFQLMENANWSCQLIFVSVNLRSDMRPTAMWWRPTAALLLSPTLLRYDFSSALL